MKAWEEHLGSVVADRYRLQKVMGVGGLGASYFALDKKSGVDVVVKLLHPSLRESEYFDLGLMRQQHPNLVKVIEAGEWEEWPYVVTNRQNSPRLADIALDPDGLLAMLKGLATALKDLNDQTGCQHLNLHPRNVFVIDIESPKPRFQIADFGQASQVKALEVLRDAMRNGVVSPEYLSPEQLSGSGPSEQSDVYALGVLLFEKFTGQVPFTAKNFSLESFLQQIQNTSPPRFKDVTDEIEWVGQREVIEGHILRCLSRSPGGRPESVFEVYETLAPLIAKLVTADCDLTIPPEMQLSSSGFSSDVINPQKPTAPAKPKPLMDVLNQEPPSDISDSTSFSDSSFLSEDVSVDANDIWGDMLDEFPPEGAPGQAGSRAVSSDTIPPTAPVPPVAQKAPAPAPRPIPPTPTPPAPPAPQKPVAPVAPREKYDDLGQAQTQYPGSKRAPAPEPEPISAPIFAAAPHQPTPAAKRPPRDDATIDPMEYQGRRESLDTILPGASTGAPGASTGGRPAGRDNGMLQSFVNADDSFERPPVKKDPLPPAPVNRPYAPADQTYSPVMPAPVAPRPSRPSAANSDATMLPGQYQPSSMSLADTLLQPPAQSSQPLNNLPPPPTRSRMPVVVLTLLLIVGAIGGGVMFFGKQRAATLKEKVVRDATDGDYSHAVGLIASVDRLTSNWVDTLELRDTVYSTGAKNVREFLKNDKVKEAVKDIAALTVAFPERQSITDLKSEVDDHLKEKLNRFLREDEFDSALTRIRGIDDVLNKMAEEKGYAVDRDLLSRMVETSGLAALQQRMKRKEYQALTQNRDLIQLQKQFRENADIQDVFAEGEFRLFLSEVKALIEKREFSSAKTRLNEYVERWSNQPARRRDALYARSSFYHEWSFRDAAQDPPSETLSRSASAVADLEALLADNPDESEARRTLASHLAWRGKWQIDRSQSSNPLIDVLMNGIRDLRGALKLNPKDEDSAQQLNVLAETYERRAEESFEATGKVSENLENFQKLIEQHYEDAARFSSVSLAASIEEPDPMPYYWRGVSRVKQPKPEYAGAIDDFEKFLKATANLEVDPEVVYLRCQVQTQEALLLAACPLAEMLNGEKAKTLAKTAIDKAESLQKQDATNQRAFLTLLNARRSYAAALARTEGGLAAQDFTEAEIIANLNPAEPWQRKYSSQQKSIIDLFYKSNLPLDLEKAKRFLQ